MSDEHPTTSEKDKSEVRLLLAEDNPVNQIVTRRILNKLGYQVDVVADGNELLEAIDRTQYDLILMDCQMPTLDGYETTQKLRKTEKNKNTIIIAMTAHALQGDREKCLAAGMNDYLAKPFDIKVLADLLHHWLHSGTKPC